jgi:large subunit ribosomal protein L6
MSRVGKQPIKIPAGVTVDIQSDKIVITGPKGILEQFNLADITFNVDNDTLNVIRANELDVTRANHGLMRSLVNNMVVGVTKGFSKTLEVNGVGFKVATTNDGLKLSLGYSHDVNYKMPEGVKAVIDANLITVSGASKQIVGQAAAEIRSLRKPEPYKGKGIKYQDERIIRKSGKSGKEK